MWWTKWWTEADKEAYQSVLPDADGRLPSRLQFKIMGSNFMPWGEFVWDQVWWTGWAISATIYGLWWRFCRHVLRMPNVGP